MSLDKRTLYRTGAIEIADVQGIFDTKPVSIFNVFNFPDTYFSFELNNSEPGEPATGTVSIEGVSKDTADKIDPSKLKKYNLVQYVNVLAGRNNLNTLIGRYVINRYEWKFANGLQTIELKITDNSKKFSAQIINKTVKGNATYKKLCEELADSGGYRLFYDVSPEFERSFNNKTFNGTFRNCVKALTGSNENIRYTMKEDNLFIYSIDKKLKDAIIKTFANGLITAPNRSKEDKWTFEMIIDGSVDINSVIQVPYDDEGRIVNINSSTYVKEFIVEKVKHSFNLKTDKTEVECREYEK